MKKRLAKKIVKQYQGPMIEVVGDGQYAISAYSNEMPKRFANDKAVRKELKNTNKFTFTFPFNINPEMNLSGFIKSIGVNIND